MTIKQGVCALAAVLLFAGAAKAEIVNWSPSWVDDDVLGSDWTWQLNSPTWTIYEPFVGLGDLEFQGAGEVVPVRGGGGSFTIDVDKDVFNDTSFAWTSYEVEISGDGTFIGLTTFDQFIDVTVNNVGGVTTILFSNGSVDPGETFNVGFEIELPAGPFAFNVMQTAIPEPTSLALLALGGVALLRRR